MLHFLELHASAGSGIRLVCSLLNQRHWLFWAQSLRRTLCVCGVAVLVSDYASITFGTLYSVQVVPMLTNWSRHSSVASAMETQKQKISPTKWDSVSFLPPCPNCLIRLLESSIWNLKRFLSQPPCPQIGILKNKIPRLSTRFRTKAFFNQQEHFNLVNGAVANHFRIVFQLKVRMRTKLIYYITFIQ